MIWFGRTTLSFLERSMEAWRFLQDSCGPVCTLLPGRLVLVAGSLSFFLHGTLAIQELIQDAVLSHVLNQVR